jgi:hypothetical protein
MSFAAEFPDMYANMKREERDTRALIGSDQGSLLFITLHDICWAKSPRSRFLWKAVAASEARRRKMQSLDNGEAQR